jgi:DNA-binding NarL/FixJ family response regulator
MAVDGLQADPWRDRVVRVALVDNHSFLRAGIAALLADFVDLEIVTSVGSVEELDAHPGVAPDVVVAELNFPRGISGPAAVRHLCQQGYRVLLITSETDAEPLRRGLEAGASGYLGKSGDGALLRSCIRAAAAGDRMRSDTVVRRLEARAPSAAPSMSAALVETFRLVARGLDNAAIAHTRGVSVGTVKKQIQEVRRLYLRQGLDVSSRIALLDAARALFPDENRVRRPEYR